MTPLDRYNLCLERLCDNTERLYATDSDSDQWAVMDQTEDLCRQTLDAIADRRREIEHKRAKEYQ